MNLIALQCTKCGSPLSFTGSLICVCPSCAMPHALVGTDGSLLHTASFVPYMPASDGKMVKSLKIQLVEKIRDESEGKYVVTNEDKFYDSEKHLIEDCVYYIDPIKNNNKYFLVGKTWTIIEKSILVGFLSNTEKTYVGSFGIGAICRITVVPVEVDDGGNKILAGHRIVIDALSPKYEEDVNELSAKIQEWYKVVPEVGLLQS
jgi:hypothetical protein